MIKSFAVFNEFASTFRLSKPFDTNDYEMTQASDHITLNPYTGNMRTVPLIWFKPDAKLSPKSLQEKLHKWLLHVGISADEDLTKIVLTLLALLSEDRHSLPDALQLIEQHILDADVIHCHVSPSQTEGWNGSLEWVGYKFGRLESKKLTYLCSRAGAKYHQKSAISLEGAPAFWSPIFKRKIIDFTRLFWKLRSPAVKKFGVDLCNAYLEKTTQIYTDLMWESLEDAFLLPFALSHPFLDFTAIRSTPEAATWTYFSKIGRDGTQSWMGLNLYDFSDHIPSHLEPVQQLLERKTEEYQLDKVNQNSNSGLHSLILGVSRSISRGKSHLASSRNDESFLFLIIALEQVFSGKENTTKAVCNRTAMVAYRLIDHPFEATLKLVKNIYDRRSKLVHCGIGAVPSTDLWLAQHLALKTLGCLTRLCARPESVEENYHGQWLKQIDFLVAGIEAGSPPNDDDLIAAGIIDPKTI